MGGLVDVLAADRPGCHLQCLEQLACGAQVRRSVPATSGQSAAVSSPSFILHTSLSGSTGWGNWLDIFRNPLLPADQGQAALGCGRDWLPGLTGASGRRVVFGGCGRQQPDGLFTVVVGLDMKEPACAIGRCHHSLDDPGPVASPGCAGSARGRRPRCGGRGHPGWGERQGDAVVLAGLQRVGAIRSLSVFAGRQQQGLQEGKRALELPGDDERLRLGVPRVEGFRTRFRPARRSGRR